ncbi:hypothetical protein DY954_07440 [Pseudomonas aeruginosa]|uniref:hypothetical protein n=1 Tax=Pseudomonas aeruginosa TaxID=287 RepID=UPI000F82E1BA|nr:hypothetical protein [Pseudomonas aeruginosa]RTT13462.1 hypothetical protein DY954_07440 [Pseudomonas aeruginosa]
MINLDKNAAVWFVDDSQVGVEFNRSVTNVRKLFFSLPESNVLAGRTSSPNKLRKFFELGIDLKGFTRKQVEQLITYGFKKTSVKLSDVDARFSQLKPTHLQTLSNFFRFAFIDLWARKKFLAPLSLMGVLHQNELYDALSLDSGVETLILLRSMSPQSALPSSNPLKDDGSGRLGFWLRLLLSTTFYSVEDMNEADIKVLFGAANGVGDLPLRRHYVNDFLVTLSRNTPSIADVVEKIISDYKIAKKEEREQASTKKARHARMHEPQERKKRNNQSLLINQSMAVAVEYSSGESALSLTDFIKNHLKPSRIKFIFNREDGIDNSPIYSRLPKKVDDFSDLLNELFRSFLKSKNYQKDSQPIFLLNLVMSYAAVYLPSFYFRRDQSLDDYPTSMNDFQCSLFITREATISDRVLKASKEMPMTFLNYLDLCAKQYEWTQDTHYSRVLMLEQWCQYVEDHNSIIPKCDKFKSTFSPACYPKIQKRYGTVKKPIPRSYFSTFISMLYSLEYLVMHINDMLVQDVVNDAGKAGYLGNFGILNGALYKPTLGELRENIAWKGIWGKEGQSYSLVDLDALNYCPIFFHEGKVQRFEFLPRFYSFSSYQIDGSWQERIVPNHIRVTQLMCETGLRQAHLIWLNKDKYDCVLDRYNQSQLAPLFVSSDKSHGAWTAIVSRRVYEVLDRQRSWYDQCSDPSYQEDLWYGFKEGARFGRYKPLFRLSKLNQTLWYNFHIFPTLLLILQYFIKVQLGDKDGADLVYLKEGKNKLPFDDYSSKFLSGIGKSSVKSDHTPHGLRAGFVSEAMNWLPASIIGSMMTGQTESLVWYYTVSDTDSMPSHQQLLENYLMKNMDKLNDGDAPELAEAVLRVNAKLMSDITADPEAAIHTHGLMSLTGVKEDKDGLGVLRGKHFTELAYNPCHICPFNNNCPQEVVRALGGERICSLCVYAIRGIVHLPAICAEKDKCKEMMAGILKKLNEYRLRKPSAQDKQVMDNLESEHDRYTREVYAYEAIEQQLYMMSRNGQGEGFFLQEKEQLLSHFERVELTSAEHLIKRLVDVQNFPDTSSPELDSQFAYMRAVMLMKEGNMLEGFKPTPKTPGMALATQIASMISTGSLDAMDVFRIASDPVKALVIEEPEVKPSLIFNSPGDV